ncbi:uncharacterized protein HD556DRAFT_1306256 [Suillus plorans]|uniref:DUF6532 domain-containing protein n=1 Tax=Suillus plorans TaxID=116603 RepID=A0A9P7DM69_9AGAM|nr:uncharacterized protein HD556DRAFT_1306256 [Suillus plorans]KAG1798229.1 hypothetical protein HD556DRAFT_1306256 [Suillus plorans]
MPPKKRARRSYEVSEGTRRSERSTRGQGGHADQLKKTGETLVAPARKGRKETNLDISDAEENPMAPSQLRKPKKTATTKRSLTGSTNPTQCSVGINKNVHSGRQQPNSGHQHSGASLRTAPSAAQSSGRFGFRQPTSTGSQNIRKAPRPNERTRDSEEEAGSQAPEHGIGDDDDDQDQDQDQDQTDGENEDRDGVQDQEQTLEIGGTTDFGQHEDDLDGEYGGDAQEDCLNQGIDGDFDDEPGTQRDKPDAQDSGTHDDSNNELDNAASDETEESETFDVLERHQMKNGRRKAPSLTYLSRAKHTERRRASSQSKSPRRPSPRRVVSTGSSALARPPKSCPVYAPFFLPRALSPFYTLKVTISAFSVTSYTRISVSPRMQSPHRRSPSRRSTSSSRATRDEPDSYRNKRKAKTVQEDPAKLGFYPPAWQAFLQAAKLEMRLQAVLTHPIPDHGDALQLAQEVLDAELWVYHEKKIKLDNGYFPQYTTQMLRLLCDDLFTFRTELKKVVISVAKASYDIFPKGTMARKDEVQKCVIAKATKLLKTGDYLRIPDSSDGKWRNFVSQALRDGCLEFYYGNSKKALKNTDEFRRAIPVNGLLLVGAVSLMNQQTKGVLTGFRETGTDKVPDLSADKCRADFNSLQKSVDALLENPDRRAELEEMLEQWAMIGMGDLDFDEGNTGGSDMEDVNIIL